VNKDKIEQYRQWRAELIDIAIHEFGFSHEVIQQLSDGHVYQEYFEDGDTPRQALQSSELNGL
jgi:hypothetical protein